MTPTLAALRHAVLLSPADDVARGVYADACLESGDDATAAHGELILLQLANADEGRQRELIGRWLGAWLPEAVTLVASPPPATHRPAHVRDEWWRVNRGAEVAVTRGLVSAVRLTDPVSADEWTAETAYLVTDHFTRHLAALFADHPLACVQIDFGEAETWGLAVADDPVAKVPVWAWHGTGAGRRWSDSFTVGERYGLSPTHVREHAGRAFLYDVCNRLFGLAHDAFSARWAAYISEPPTGPSTPSPAA